MKADNLDELRKTLLYHNTIDVWMALCREKGWNWRELRAYSNFLEHLKILNVKLDSAKVKHALTAISGQPVKSYTIRLDTKLLPKLRSLSLEA